MEIEQTPPPLSTRRPLPAVAAAGAGPVAVLHAVRLVNLPCLALPMPCPMAGGVGVGVGVDAPPVAGDQLKSPALFFMSNYLPLPLTCRRPCLCLTPQS